MHCLHVCDVAHMDVTSNNIMLRKDDYKAWDQLRLLDFGFAQSCSAGRHALFAYHRPFVNCQMQQSCTQDDASSCVLLIASQTTV